MKKTLTINLSGTVFHIDEDAYRLLDNYLSNLRIHFRREEDGEEIVRDMEQRIAELFNARLHEGKQVITIEDVEEIIAQMGQPEDLDSDGACTSAEEGKGSTPRRLFRDPDNKVFGGVASGIAAYMRWDVVWVRLALLLAIVLFQGTILAYIIAWIIIPEAKSASEKLAMQGKKINLENIGRTVTDNFERATEKVNDYVRSDRPRSTMRRVGEGIVSVAGFLIKFALVLFAICCTPIILAFLVSFVALLLAGVGVIASVPAVLISLFPMVDWAAAGTSPVPTVLLSLAGILAIGIPIIGVTHLLMRCFGGWQPMSMATRIIFIVLWLVALGIGIYFLLDSSYIASHIYY